MYILCNNYGGYIPPNKRMKKLGIYLKDNIPNVYNYKSSANIYDIYIKKGDSCYNVSITTYDNTIRINIYDITNGNMDIIWHTTYKLDNMPIYEDILQKITSII